MTDTILFVKETKTCHYVMVIHTPRLCGERGFKTRLEQRDEAFIRCREVLADEAALAAVDKSLPETPYPTQLRTRNPILGAPPTLPTASAAEETAEADGRRKTAVSPLAERAILQAIEALLVAGAAGGGNTKGAGTGSQQHQAEGTGESSGVHVTPGKDGEVIIEFFDAADGENVGRLEEIIDSFLAESSGNYQRLQDILRSAGHVIDGANRQQSQEDERQPVDEADGTETRKHKKDEDARRVQQRHEEL